MPTSAPADQTGDPEVVHQLFETVRAEVGKVIVGQDEIVRLLLLSLFARGHCLLVGVPGLAKTLLVRTLAQTLDLSFGRIQFTPDLMPSDILGSELLHEHEQRLQFEFKPGPVFTNLLLADEINRTPPKTQAALLEAMQERSVTTAGKSRPLPNPFLVVATQNPIEQEGTYPLPEAQLDRFMFSLHLDYPSREEEIEIVRRTTYESEPQAGKTIGAAQILQADELLRALPVSEHVLGYAVDLVKATRPGSVNAPSVTNDFVEWGAGPRASQYLILGAKAMALFNGRPTPEISDVREVALPVLRHRVIGNYRATGEGKSSSDILREILKIVPEPVY
ncbi:MoxR family ATPase [Ruficoccus amylovorans]|uniref:MoxR family ATPase n=1 Tax=Ruficoccus amylovorans TaxID=1804625 RepID=A0A842HEE1_9BACT|nr:MoxR family ATPase [Ruficoccus amylovorans]MBC2593947.1 MoxR family ATPase [Ruficoccus amylovorans]